MLFEFEYLVHEINKVGELPIHFLEESMVQDRYSDKVYPVWFRPVIMKTPAVKKRFKDAFKAIQVYKKSNFPELLLLVDDLKRGYDISTLCNDTDLEGPRTELLSKDLHNTIKTLFGTFFEETLKDSKNLFKVLSSSYEDQYYKFRKKNLQQGKVCPMCGIHEYPLIKHEPIAQYDHWLPQDIYPLLSINYRNLVPICGICNGIKLNKDLIYDITRTTAFYPYLAHNGLNFSISSYTPFDKLDKKDQVFHPYGLYSVEITSNNPLDNSKIKGWNRVFNIKSRSSTYISDYYDDLKEKLGKYISEVGIVFNNGAPKADLITFVDRFKNNRISSIRREPGAHLKHVFLDYLKEEGNEHMLYTFFSIKASP